MSGRTSPRNYVVLCVPKNVIFKTCSTEAEAERTAVQLRAIGCPAVVEPARRGDVAGLTRRLRRA